MSMCIRARLNERVCDMYMSRSLYECVWGAHVRVSVCVHMCVWCVSVYIHSEYVCVSVCVCVSVSWGYFGLTSSYSAGGPAPPPHCPDRLCSELRPGSQCDSSRGLQGPLLREVSVQRIDTRERLLYVSGMS